LKLLNKAEKQFYYKSGFVINLLQKFSLVWGMVMMGRANLIREFKPDPQRREVLDWFHLMENLYKVGGSMKRLKKAEAFLWKGQIDSAIALFSDFHNKQAQNFGLYLQKHRHRIINYEYHQAEEICSIGSGAIESTIKQIDRRTKISGAQWKQENVPQVLAHRCAYLNGLILAS
jgi:hypothetical protein